MTDKVSTPVTQPTSPATSAPSPGWTPRRTFIIIVGAIILFLGTYGFAWLTSYNLSNKYFQDADTSYTAGEYLRSLVGYEEYDRITKSYITHGGYAMVKNIWASSYAWPRPANIQHAQQKIDEIIGERMTIEDAEQFVQEHIGQSNPYLGVIYLRLGELYETANRFSEARDVYTSFASNFPDDAELIQRAAQDLANLQAKYF